MDQDNETKLKKFQQTSVGIRVGLKRTEENDRTILQQRERLQTAKAATQKAKQDIQRQLSKLQRKCHHRFNKSTGHCEFCDKPRSQG